MIFLSAVEKLTHLPRVSAIQFFNSLTGQLETEKVYGESFLTFAYGNPLGKIALHAYIKRPAFSAWYGKRMNQPSSRAKIQPFIDTYGLSTDEFAAPVDSFVNFNQFFYRKLKPSARPIDADPRSIVFPADGRHLAFPKASAIDSVFVKDQKFDLQQLLESEQLAARYRQGSLVLSRLCPVDYHRFHFPVTGTVSHTKVINQDTTAWVLGANYTMGAGKILAGYGQKQVDGAPKVKQFSLGYEYSLSKRTYIYADVSNKKGAPAVAPSTKTSINYYSLGVNHSF